MALKNLLRTAKLGNKSLVLQRLDQYLISLNEDSDRALNVNAPSQVGKCCREIYYGRVNGGEDSAPIDPRTRRIFDNGHGVHDRLQEYLKKEGVLIQDEVPLRNDPFNIQGHTDGFLKISPLEIAILEIKSMNSISFNKLTEAKPEHIQQAMVYLFCAEMRRQDLREDYPTFEDFNSSGKDRVQYFESLYNHLKDGSKFTREEKLKNKVDEHLKCDTILYNITKPITKVVLLYENKDNQDIKEFVVHYDEDLMNEILVKYEYINECIEKEEVPPREGKNKSSTTCRYCNYKSYCWIV